jgi:hypothetical protein
MQKRKRASDRSLSLFTLAVARALARLGHHEGGRLIGLTGLRWRRWRRRRRRLLFPRGGARPWRRRIRRTEQRLSFDVHEFKVTHRATSVPHRIENRDLAPLSVVAELIGCGTGLPQVYANLLVLGGRLVQPQRSEAQLRKVFIGVEKYAAALPDAVDRDLTERGSTLLLARYHDLVEVVLEHAATFIFIRRLETRLALDPKTQHARSRFGHLDMIGRRFARPHIAPTVRKVGSHIARR